MEMEKNKNIEKETPLPKGPVYDPDEMMDGFVASLLSSRICPQRILVRTEETAVLLKPLCEKARIELAVGQDLEALDEAAEQMWEYQKANDHLSEVIRMLNDMSPDQIRALPRDMLNQMMEAEGLLPAQLIDKIRKALQN